MPWDSSRPVPWRRLAVEWAIFAGIMAVVFAFVSEASAGAYIGLLASLPLYLVFGGVLAKFGYQRKSLRDLRAQDAAKRAAAASASASPDTAAPRARPAPTKRTSSGRSNRPARPKRR